MHTCPHALMHACTHVHAHAHTHTHTAGRHLAPAGVATLYVTLKVEERKPLHDHSLAPSLSLVLPTHHSPDLPSCPPHSHPLTDSTQPPSHHDVTSPHFTEVSMPAALPPDYTAPPLDPDRFCYMTLLILCDYMQICILLYVTCIICLVNQL